MDNSRWTRPLMSPEGERNGEARILVIEDDPGIRRILEEELEFEGFDAIFEEEGTAGYEAVFGHRPDLVLLDLRLPGMSGFEICRRLRRERIDTPVIIMTARSEETEIVRGLGLGADDYVVKPFSLAELVARIRAVLRRSRRAASDDLHRLGDLQVDFKRCEVFEGGRRIHLTHKELEILRLLFEREGAVVSRDEFLDETWTGIHVTQRTVDTHMTALRKKLGDDPHAPKYILSVRGVGYRLNDGPRIA